MTRPTSFHERLERPDIPRGSERNFGLTLAGFFALLALAGWWREGQPRWIWLVISLALAGLAILAPAWLAPANKAWHRLGLALGVIVTPVVMLGIFVVGVIPTGMALRLFGKDTLHLKWDRKARTYWIERAPPGPAPDTMKYRF